MPRNDTLTSIGATRALAAQARDAGNNIVAGSFSWVTRNAGVATASMLSSWGESAQETTLWTRSGLPLVVTLRRKGQDAFAIGF